MRLPTHGSDDADAVNWHKFFASTRLYAEVLPGDADDAGQLLSAWEDVKNDQLVLRTAAALRKIVFVGQQAMVDSREVSAVLARGEMTYTPATRAISAGHVALRAAACLRT